jgi:hypothetical protein
MAEPVQPQPLKGSQVNFTLLLDLEAIKQFMVEKKGANLKAKGKGGTAPSKAKGNPKRMASEGPTR